ncbi:hypothetical protein LTR10_001674 [Elasticomyces elasticus]|nr:hypothetical protein LTR10_001674 [Elasticomyces elasticus]KAK4975176.1 hypothetical protein LTR42_004386 [Elasticomyces elasticus]
MPNFTDMPAEIRNQIYLESLSTPITLVICPGPVVPTPTENLALLSTNRQIRSEAYGYHIDAATVEINLNDEIFFGTRDNKGALLAAKLIEGLDKHGSKIEQVTHLKVVGNQALFALLHDPNTNTQLVNYHYNHEGDVQKYELLKDSEDSKALVAVRERLSKVEIIEMTAPDYDYVTVAPWWWLDRVMPCCCFKQTCQQCQRIGAIFPNLKEIRMQSENFKWCAPVGFRWLKCSDGGWRLWCSTMEQEQEAVAADEAIRATTGVWQL